MRLTKKELTDAINHPMCFGSRLVGKTMFAKMVNELCEYKDAEEDLGINLNIFVKAIKYGFYAKIFNSVSKVSVNDIDFKHCLFYGTDELTGSLHCYPFKRCKEDWALTEEELL